MKITNNFTRDWTREKALEVVTSAFDWVETNADTNPARALQKRLQIELDGKNLKYKQLRADFDKYQAEKETLLTEQNQVGAQQAEYRRMASSGLFTEDEMRTPAITGSTVAQTLITSTRQLEEHKDKVRKLSDVYEAWKAFVSEHGESARPAAYAIEIEEALSTAKIIADEIQETLKAARNQRKPLEKASNDALQKYNAADARLNRYLETSPAALKFKEVFGDVSPVGIERKVVDALNESQSRLVTIANERKLFSASLHALKTFNSEHSGIDPETWLNQKLSKWETLGTEISQHNSDLSEARLRRAALDAAVIVAGRVAREAAQVAGGKHLPLHVAVAKMSLDDSRREKILTLFSALLHTPVYQSVAEAADAANRLEKAGIEAPVFAYPELEVFCLTGTISLDAVSSHTWLVGVKTRQVDCLLDPTLVEREKVLLDEQVYALNQFIQNKEQERASHSPESAAAARARLAIEAVKNGYEVKDSELEGESKKLEADLPELKSRASDENVNIIRQAERHYKEFKDVDEAALRTEHHTYEEAKQRADMAYEVNEASIVDAEQRQSSQQEILGAAIIAAGKLDVLNKIQAFIEHGEDNPAFMASAKVIEGELSGARTTADNRSRYQFDLADAFIKQGHDRLKKIEERLGYLNGERAEIQDRLLPALNTTIQVLQEKLIAIGKNAMSIDVFIRNLIQKYRELSAMQDDLAPISKEQIESRTLGGAAIGLREANLEDRMAMLIDISNDIQLDESAGNRLVEMNEARSHYMSSKAAFEALVDKVLVMADMDMTEHVRLELVRAKETPAIVDHLHAVATQNFEKNSAANATAAAYLESEWENIGKWLKSFTQRLPDNLRTMKEVFSPIKDKTSGEYLSAGFEIEAKLADQEDIKAILDDVVKMVEKFESTRHAVESAAPGIRDQAVRGMRAEIRNTFYHKVITNPRIKVYMPSISKHSLLLEKGMVSTGQGVAMTLLWVVKMADYVTERELRRVTTSRVQQKHLHPTQFAIMDGAFSSLSNKGLIQDALNSIKGTRGRFQLIITGHDENYQNNFEYFPTLIEAREINGQFMYADSKTKRVLQPEDVGSHYGAIGVMSLRVKPQQDGAAAI